MCLGVPALLAMGWTGCYRASGFQRSTIAAEAIPEFGGDRVSGLKAMSGPGDYYLGNDFIQIAVDGTRFGDTSQMPIAGAAAGGSIVDAGYLTLDTSYARVGMPGDSLERLTPVANQDPDLEIVFDSFLPDSSTDPSTLTMTGGLLDPKHKITGATLDASGRIMGVTVVHTISLGKLDRFLTLSTVLRNDSGSPLGIRSVGDFLYQATGGFTFSIPAGLSIGGTVLPQPWGVQIPGSSFGSPIATAVQAPVAAMLAFEPGSTSQDSHTSMALSPVDAPTFMVTCDPQEVFQGVRPTVANRLVVGSLPLPPSGLAAGGTISFNRRLYLTGGQSTGATTPNQGTALNNVIANDKYNTTNGFWPQDFGSLLFTLMGSAQKMGPLPTEVRIERNAGGNLGTPVWVPERVEWLEPGEIITSQGSMPSSSAVCILPVGTYRLVITNQLGTQIKQVSVDPTSQLGPLLTGPITILPNELFTLGNMDYLCPEAGLITDAAGVAVRSFYTPHYFDTREYNAPQGSLQPMRITMKGLDGAPDPWMRRTRTLSTFFSAITKYVAIAGGSAPGQIQFRGGNEMFGTGFAAYVQTRFFWFPNGSVTGAVNPDGSPVISGGHFRAYATRGPLSNLEHLDFYTYDGQPNNVHSFIIWPQALPAGWTTFDVPGPSLATGGATLPAEKLASGMAEGVHVVGHTEKDLGTDAQGLYNDFTWEFNAAGYNAAQLTAVGNDPFVVGGRTSVLPGFGTVTALFTPPSTSERFGGAQQPNKWTLADFITQAQGQYTVVHQPRGPQGLFTQAGFDATQAVGQGPNAWWNGSGVYANGALNGGFDALELLRGEGFDAANPGPWFSQFLQVRTDWFGLLNQQTPTRFTKALGLSSAKSTLDTPVGLARTYLKATPVLTNPPTATILPDQTQPLLQDLSTVLAALKSGAAVASTGPFLDVSIGAAGPGGLVAGPMPTATLSVNLYRTDWMPVDELRIVVNGTVVSRVDPATLTQSAADARLWTGSFKVPMPTTGTGAWLVVEAGVPLTQTGPYAVGTPWHDLMRGIYPIAVTNPIFIDVTGHGYTHP